MRVRVSVERVQGGSVDMSGVGGCEIGRGGEKEKKKDTQRVSSSKHAPITWVEGREGLGLGA